MRPLRIVDLGSCNGYFALKAAYRRNPSRGGFGALGRDFEESNVGNSIDADDSSSLSVEKQLLKP